MLDRLKAHWTAYREAARQRRAFRPPRRGRRWWQIRPLPSLFELSLAFTIIGAGITADWLGLFSRVSANMAEATPAFDSFGPARAVSGDTIGFQGSEVHLAGIVAPPRDRTCRNKADGRRIDCGAIAGDTLGALVKDREVRCAGEGRDRQRRKQASCSVVIGGRRTDLAFYMAANGWAAADRLDSKRFAMDEVAARVRQIGLWATDYLPPEPSPAGEIAAR